MVHSCCARGCKERSKKGGAVTFHCFPRNEERRKLWMQNSGRYYLGPSMAAKICSKHFTEDSFDLAKLGGTWLKPNAVPTIFVDTEYSRVNKSPKSGVNDASTHEPQKLGSIGNNCIGDFEYEDVGLPEKAAAAAAAAASTEKAQPNFEPEIVIKEEPIDIDEDQLPSTSRTGDEFILPWTPADVPSTSAGRTPSLGVAFTVCKTEVVTDDDQEADTGKRTSNGKSTKSPKKKASKVEVERTEKRPRESEDDSAKDRTKDHFDAYGEYIAAKLRKLDWKSCAYVQKAIGDIIFEAEMGKFK